MTMCQQCHVRAARIKWCAECADEKFKRMQRKYSLARWLRTHPKGPCTHCGKTLERGQRKWCLNCTIPQRKRVRWAAERRRKLRVAA